MLCGIAMMGLSACSDFFEPENNTMLKGDDYIKEAREMSTCMHCPIMNRI